MNQPQPGDAVPGQDEGSRQAPDPTSALVGLLTGQVEPGVYAWQPGNPLAASDWVAQSEQAGWRPIELDGRGITGKEAFLRRCAEVFSFPEWFGENWDALEDSLTDLAWLPAQAGYLVVYAAWDDLAEADPGSFRTALDIFAEAVESWRDSATPMAVLLPTHHNTTGLPPLA